MIEICIGSACHLKGSYQVIQEMKELLQDKELTSKVELKSSFCLGKCGDGVSIRVNKDQIYSIKAENVKEFLEEHIGEFE